VQQIRGGERGAGIGRFDQSGNELFANAARRDAPDGAFCLVFRLYLQGEDLRESLTGHA
jgi:hypothetical protein